MYTIRDIITDACIEVNLGTREQPINSAIFESAYNLLQKRLAQYSNTNLLSFIRKEVDFTANKKEITIGEYELRDPYVFGVNFFEGKTLDDLPAAASVPSNSRALVFYKDGGVYSPFISSRIGVGPGQYTWTTTSLKPSDFMLFWPDVLVKNMQEVVRCYKKSGNEYEELDFISYEDWYGYDDGLIYSILPVSDTLHKLYLKDTGDFKLMYNESFELNMDSELRIPNQYVSLFIAGLAYDLAVAYPRLSDTTVALLKDRLTELEANVRRSSAKSKFIRRKYSKQNMSWDAFVSGRFLGI